MVELVVLWCDDEEGRGLMLVVGWGCMLVVLILVGVVIVGCAVEGKTVALGKTGRQAPLYGKMSVYCRKETQHW